VQKPAAGEAAADKNLLPCLPHRGMAAAQELSQIVTT